MEKNDYKERRYHGFEISKGIDDIRNYADFKHFMRDYMTVSGLYVAGHDQKPIFKNRRYNPFKDLPLLHREELRLDVDGRYPQMTASGRVVFSHRMITHWIADVIKVNDDTWEGDISYLHPNPNYFKYTSIRIEVQRNIYDSAKKANVTFYNAKTSWQCTYSFKSKYFHPLMFEYDFAEGSEPLLSINTHIHSTHPATLPEEDLTIEMVYRRTGFDVSTTQGDLVPLSLAGADENWSDQELHDAMKVYWSHFADAPQWSVWVFFAERHKYWPYAAGMMFDGIGPNHRQGAAIFTDSAYYDYAEGAPSNQVEKENWKKRYRFFVACHEIGHCLNLAHSWEKEKILPFGTSWVTLTADTSSTSFMNYPWYYPNGEIAYLLNNNSESDFFSNFEYRFDDDELLFIRHAPISFVQPGNANWWDNHGFGNVKTTAQPILTLEVRANRENPAFEFMEPVVLELKLKNESNRPVVLDENLLSRHDSMTIIIKKDGKPARQFIPYARYDFLAKTNVLESGAADYESLFLSSGINGWDLAEPGYYTIQVCLHLNNIDVISNPFRMRITPPLEREEEWLAQDFFSEDVGRILTFGGSQVLTAGINTLKEVSNRLKNRKVAYHARMSFAQSIASPYKRLELRKEDKPLMSASAAGGRIVVSKPDVKTAKKEFSAALTTNANEAAESLGHINYKWYTDHYSDWLTDQGETAKATEVQDNLLKTLKKRGVIKPVLQDIASRRDGFKKKIKK